MIPEGGRSREVNENGRDSSLNKTRIQDRHDRGKAGKTRFESEGKPVKQSSTLQAKRTDVVEDDLEE